MLRRIAIAGAALAVLLIFLTPAFVTSEVREYAPPRTYTENPPPTYPERPTIVFPLGSLHSPSEGLSEPRKDRP